MSARDESDERPPLCDQEERVLAHLRECLRAGRAPTNAEGAIAMGWSSPRAWAKWVEALEEKGYVERGAGHRNLRVVGAETGFCMRVLGAVAAGEPIDPTVTEFERIELQKRFDRIDVFWVRVRGDSMIDAHIASGDYVAVRHTPEADHGDIVVVRIAGDFTLKRIEYRGKGVKREVLLMPLNKHCKPIRLRVGEDAEIVGTFQGMIRLV